MVAVMNRADQYEGFERVSPSLVARAPQDQRASTLATSDDSDFAVTFLGRLEIPGLVTPALSFDLLRRGHTATLAAPPLESWPGIRIRLRVGSGGRVLAVEEFLLETAAATAEADVIATRISLAIERSGEVAVAAVDLESPMRVLRFSVEKLAAADRRQLELAAAVARKLLLIELVSGVPFSLPEVVTPGEVGRVEEVFRAITEREFDMRQSELDLTLDWNPAALLRPPFSGPGPLAVNFDIPVQVLGKSVFLGPFEISSAWCLAKNPRTARRAPSGPQRLRFAVLDRRVHVRYPALAHAAGRLDETVRAFERELAKDEPREFAALLHASLATRVDAREVLRIATGWLVAHGFPDRFTPRDPALDRAHGVWRVPLLVTYGDLGTAEVGELNVDAVTGLLCDEPDAQTVLERGLAEGRSITHAS